VSVAVVTNPPVQSAVRDEANQTASGYFDDARQAFLNGNYREALRLAGHAAVDNPQDAAVHELMSLALFALKDYRGAAMEAHAALSLGPAINWETLFAYYGNAETYTTQLRALEAFVGDNPKKPEGRFLLGYHYIMTGHPDVAKKQLEAAVAITPGDKLAAELLKQISK
jgi:tetratricopeptide (TPR) repeat protein